MLVLINVYCITIRIVCADMRIMFVLFVCIVYTKSKIKQVDQVVLLLQVVMLLHLQILLALVCMVGLGWRGYTPILSLLVRRNFILGFELFLVFLPSLSGL